MPKEVATFLLPIQREPSAQAVPTTGPAQVKTRQAEEDQCNGRECDDLFANIAQFATPVTPHIAIDNATKTVKSGALWYEETLPPDTVFYLSLAASSSRRKDAEIAASQIIEHTLSLFPSEKPYLQLGGNETIGMGWCRVSRVEA